MLENNLARRIFFYMLLLVLIPLFTVTVQQLHCAQQAVTEMEFNHLQSLLDARRDQLENWVKMRERDLSLSCYMSCPQPDCTGLSGHMSPDHFKALRNEFGIFRLGHSLYDSLEVYDKNWSLIGRKESLSHSENIPIRDEQMVNLLNSGTGIVATVTHKHQGDEVGLHLGISVRNAQDEVQGYVLVNVKLEETLYEILNNPSGLGQTGRMYLVSENGQYLTQPKGINRDLGGVATVPERLLKDVTREVLTYKGADGHKVLGTSAFIPKFQWVLVAEVSRSEGLRWFSVIWKRALITGGLCFVVILGFASVASRRLSEPLRILAKTARRIIGGAHTERVPELPGSESNEVGHALNDMLDSLAAAQENIVQSASLAAVGELSASIVHEMRNPLSSIKINLQALQKKVKDDPNDAELAEIASAQTQRLDRMLAELLRFGRPVELRCKFISFHSLAQQAIIGLEGLIQDKQLKVSISDDLSADSLYVDVEHMQRVIKNLLCNAFQASPTGGTIWLSARSEGSRQKIAVITVRDEGSGVSELILPKLFQPFVTTKNEGTGLGLANVKKIVEMHKGRVSVENEPGGGATFTIRLPLPSGAV